MINDITSLVLAYPSFAGLRAWGIICEEWRQLERAGIVTKAWDAASSSYKVIVLDEQRLKIAHALAMLKEAA